METIKTDIIALKKIMVEKNISTVSELAEKSGINRNTLSSVLKGDSQPSRDVMTRLVITLEIPSNNAGDIFFVRELREA